MKLLNYLVLIFYSFSLTIIWGLTMLDNGENTNELSAFIGYAFTCYSLYLLKESSYYKNAKYPYLFVLVGPINMSDIVLKTNNCQILFGVNVVFSIK